MQQKIRTTKIFGIESFLLLLIGTIAFSSLLKVVQYSAIKLTYIEPETISGKVGDPIQEFATKFNASIQPTLIDRIKKSAEDGINSLADRFKAVQLPSLPQVPPAGLPQVSMPQVPQANFPSAAPGQPQVLPQQQEEVIQGKTCNDPLGEKQNAYPWAYRKYCGATPCTENPLGYGMDWNQCAIVNPQQ
jgi:hypothetical protein